MKALGVEFVHQTRHRRVRQRRHRARRAGANREERCEELGAEVGAAVHVGDTPNDVKAAEFGGAKATGVTTGVFDADALLRAAGDNKANVTVMDGLTDVDAVLRACGLAP